MTWGTGTCLHERTIGRARPRQSQPRLHVKGEPLERMEAFVCEGEKAGGRMNPLDKRVAHLAHLLVDLVTVHLREPPL
jgi:hypothetical protein